jgi:hypothetical protein
LRGGGGVDGGGNAKFLYSQVLLGGARADGSDLMVEETESFMLHLLRQLDRKIAWRAVHRAGRESPHDGATL